MPTSPETFAVLEAHQRAVKATREARGACVNPTHDHNTYYLVTGDGVREPVNMSCWSDGCGEHSHYDTAADDYFHNDPDAPKCFYAGPNLANPCTPKE